MNAHAFGSDQLTEGWLVKEAVGKTGMWRKRWFVFRNNALCAFPHQPTRTPSQPARGDTSN